MRGMTLKWLIFATMRWSAVIWMAWFVSTARACWWNLAVVKHHQQCSTLSCDTRSRVELAEDTVAKYRQLLSHAFDELQEAEHAEFLNAVGFVLGRVPRIQTPHLVFVWSAWLIALSILLAVESCRVKSRHQTALNKLQAVDNLVVMCSICYDEQGSWKQLPCGHVFHGACIERWFLHSTTCPNCRLNVMQC